MSDKKPVQNEYGDLVGWSVEPVTAAKVPNVKIYSGRFFSLHPVDAATQSAELFAAATEQPDADRMWAYMPYGPFRDVNALRQHQQQCANSDDPLFFTVVENESTRPVGMVSFLNITTTARSIELGHIWYVPNVQGSKANSEVCFLMLCEAFDNSAYRRVEWKCNALNLKSRAAAQRMGFSFEGVFRQHLIVKGQNRDTAWFSMLDHEWPAFKENMAAWLYTESSADPPASLSQLNRPLLHAKDPDLPDEQERAK